MKKAETRLSIKVRKHLLEKYGIRLHKNTGGAYSETGAADLYGTLPGGRAIYIELKTPKTIDKKNNRAIFQGMWLQHEASQGALAFVASSIEVIEAALKSAGIYPHGQKEIL
jgi:hypothetical protein